MIKINTLQINKKQQELTNNFNSKKLAISLVISKMHDKFHQIENISKIQLKFTKVLSNNNNISFNSHSK